MFVLYYKFQFLNESALSRWRGMGGMGRGLSTFPNSVAPVFIKELFKVLVYLIRKFYSPVYKHDETIKFAVKCLDLPAKSSRIFQLRTWELRRLWCHCQGVPSLRFVFFLEDKMWVCIKEKATVVPLTISRNFPIPMLQWNILVIRTRSRVFTMESHGGVWLWDCEAGSCIEGGLREEITI